ncbi:two-component regulator propeller domain-containing protein [Maribacter algicola]|uniref:Two-component regulator propeller domain-containing protein n=1 Tax=Meishania litoralis TaxID=3434685 RepID=A0ACC7LIP6_9FLAO
MPFANAQSQISFRQLSVKDGLSQNSAISVSQDSTGYLWVATQDGLNRYDGKKFTKFPYSFLDITKPDYSDLGQVYTDRDGTVWIIPLDQRLHKFNVARQKFEPIHDTDGASFIYQDLALNIWLGTRERGLLRFDSKTKTFSEIEIPNFKGTIFKILQGNPENEGLLLLTNKGIIKFRPQANRFQPMDVRTADGKKIEAIVSDVVYTGKNRQWISTFGDGLYFKDGNEGALNRISSLSFVNALPVDLNILDLYIDTKGRLWVATYGRGLYMIDFDTMKIDHFKVEKHNPRALHYKDVLCVYEDYSGTLWFGTDGAGLSYYDEYLEKFNSIKNYQTPDGINVDVVRSIVVDKKDAVWIGTSGKGLTQYEPETNSWRTFNVELGNNRALSSDRIMSLMVDGDNSLWIGTQGGGLMLLDDKDEMTYFSTNSKPRLSAKTIWAIYKDSKDRVWLGTRETGIILFDKKKGEIKKYVADPNTQKGPSSNNIRVITEDGSGNLWIGTESNGIVFFDTQNEQFTPYRKTDDSNSLANDGIKSLHYDPKGILWIGTNGGGLSAFDLKSQRFYSYTMEDGLANDVIYAILPDQEGNLWLSSNRGITRFTPPTTFKEAPEIVNYDNYDGLATEFNTGAHFKDDRGSLYFGGLDGIYWFNPKEIKENDIMPRTTITGLEIFDEPFPMSSKAKLESDKNTLTFTFSSLQYSLPQKNKYQYRLEGYDDDWVRAGNVNFARYSQLPPGEYEFQVKSSNYDGIWNENPATFKFVIAPPWYLTNLAKFIYLILFFTAIYTIYQYLKWRMKMRLDLKMKEREALRLKKLNDLKSKLYTDISHEFRTPLTLISGPIDAELAKGHLTRSEFSNFSMIKRNTDRLMALVDQLLHLAKLEKGKLRINLFQGNLGLFLKAMAASFEYQAERKNITYQVKIENLKNGWYDEDALEKIVTNLLSNAFKYAPSGGKCSFEANGKKGRLSLSVRNTVDDPEKIKIDKLFDRFYQLDDYAEGAGVGLSLVSELVKLYKGNVNVRIEDDNTIHFQIDLPLNNELAENVPNSDNSSLIDGIKEDGVPQADMTLGTSKTEEDKELPIILIVEDHAEVREFLISVWMNRYRVIAAADGEKGIAKALKEVPDLIISDVRMPICDGITLCNTLKTDQRTSHIPIILLTAGIGEEQELLGLESGADDFIEKPFKLRILEKRVENLIETRKILRNRYGQEVVLKAKDIAITPTDEIFLNRVQKILDEKLSDSDFNAAIFCKTLGMSRMQLHRKLQMYTGLSTTEFIRSQRLKQAVNILKTSDASINEVAYTVGFNTPSYFIKCFKEVYKTTPSEYLQNVASN